MSSLPLPFIIVEIGFKILIFLFIFSLSKSMLTKILPDKIVSDAIKFYIIVIITSVAIAFIAYSVFGGSQVSYQRVT